MSEPQSPKTFRAADTAPSKLWILIALQSCIIIALLAHILLKQNTEVAATRAQPRYEPPRDEPLPAARSETPPPSAPPPVPLEATKLANVEPPDARLSFRFNYLDSPDKWREWRRVSPTQWEEVEPNGNLTRFVVVGRLKEETMFGTIVRRVSDLKMDVFIPDKTSTRRMHWRIPPDGKWNYMGQVSAEAALPAANEEF